MSKHEGIEWVKLKFYTDQAVSDDFVQISAKAGDRPEIKAFEIRGNINNFKIRVQQDIQTLLNKHTTIDLADKIVEEGLKSYTIGMEFEKLNFIVNQIFVQIYEKACVEKKFIQTFA